MEKEAFAQKMMIPEIDESAVKYLNRTKFLNEIVPLLETFYQNNPEHYQSFLDSFRQNNPEREPDFSDVLEYMLIYLSGVFEIDFYVEENAQMYAVESIECALLKQLWRQPEPNEMKRQRLCRHCAEFHFIKYFRLYNAAFKFQIHQSGCQFFIEKINREKINPLFY
jgi:hypothetical protein